MSQEPRRTALRDCILDRQSYLCVGLDPDLQRLPEGIQPTIAGIKTFLLQIVQATAPYCVAYKPNFAFFEALGPAGGELLKEIIQEIPDDHLVIGDAKRGDIGNTASHYARAAFASYDCDAVTVSPYMGVDTLDPFLAWKDRWTIILALTSNPGSAHFQRQVLADGMPLWEKVLQDCQAHADPENTMYVIGGTHPHDFHRVREITPDTFLLVPGFGAQGGSLEDVSRAGLNTYVGLLANVSRGILYASSGQDYRQAAAQVARSYRDQMRSILDSEYSG